MEEDSALTYRIPPGQLLTQRFPVLHYGQVPEFDPQTWAFMVWGEVEKPLRLSWQEFNALPKTRVKMDLHCVTTWSKLDTEWEGVTLSTLEGLGLVRLNPEARFVVQHAAFGFTANLPVPVFRAENFLMATDYNGHPLTPEHGAPLRGVCGAISSRRDRKDVYLWKGAKWLCGLEFCRNDRPGFWEQAGYHNQADVWLEQRIQAH
ncbi:MAG: molybdopterin-dependent oxidoreductase [Anaerolineaceae bacterium]|nr:molybdopterin-dependent oxidoreductase [Anaerolineaceae bacterium]